MESWGGGSTRSAHPGGRPRSRSPRVGPTGWSSRGTTRSSRSTAGTRVSGRWSWPRTLLSDRVSALGLPRLLTWAWAALLVGACVGGLIARKTPPRAVVYTVWADRDLGRAAAVPHDFPTSGPEFTRGSRTPGGFFYLFLWPQLLLTREPLVLHRLMNVLNVVALGLLAALGFRLAGKWAALVCAALFAACPAQLDLLRFVAYNPNYPLLPGVGAYWLFCDMLVFDRPSRLPFLVALVAAASQMHFSFILLLPAFLLVL